jgi:hypothetical protein
MCHFCKKNNKKRYYKSDYYMNQSKKRSLTSIINDIDHKNIRQSIKKRKENIEKTQEKCLSLDIYDNIKKKQEIKLVNYILEELLEYVVEMLNNGIQLDQKNITALLSHSFETAKLMYINVDSDITVLQFIPALKKRLNAILRSKIHGIIVDISYDETDVIARDKLEALKRYMRVYITIELPSQLIDDNNDKK